MLSSLPRLIGHRGAAASAPENTLAGLDEAARQGARWVEFDVMLTADGQPVLFHDDLVDRTTDGKGLLSALTLAELRTLDAGRWFGERFAGERIPTLQEAMARVISLDLGLNLEIKPCPGLEVETARVVIETIHGIWPDDRPLLLSSFAIASLEVARDLAPALPRGYLMDEEPADWLAIADRLKVTTLNVDADRQTAQTVAALTSTGRPVLAYTVNDPGRAARLFDWGVSALFTDEPGRMASAIGGSQ